MEQYYRLATTFDEYDIYYGLYTMGYLVGTDRKDNLRFLLPKEIYTLIHS